MRPSKREILLDTAEKLFYEEGFHGTGIDRVVAEAGVVRMTLYNHFPSKEALIEAVLDRRQRRYLDALRTAVDSPGDGPAVSRLVRAHCRWLKNTGNRGCMLLKAMGEFEHHHAGIHRLALGYKRQVLGLIAEALSMDELARVKGLKERIYIILEGASSLTPVLGPKRAGDHALALFQSLMDKDAETSS